MNTKEEFECLMNTLALTLQLTQAGVLTPSECNKESKTIYSKIKELLGLPNESISTFKI